MNKRMPALFLASTVTLLVLCSCNAPVTQHTNTDVETQEKFVEIYGKVKEINGNEVTLVLGESGIPSAQGNPDRTARWENPPAGNSEGEGSGPMAGGVVPPGEGEDAGEASTPSQRRPSGGNTPSSDGEPTFSMGERGGEAIVFGQGAPPSGAGDGNARTREAPSEGAIAGGGTVGGQPGISYTGEEVTYQIPVTASITTGEGENARTISFAQIGYKNVLKLTMDQNGNIVSVAILQ